jgi:Mrp family chromosome partitioning ATPase
LNGNGNGERDGGFTILRATIESAFDFPLSVTVTSARPGDGKTQVASGLALAFSHAGIRTILIDANPANPSVASALNASRLRVPASLDDGSALAAVKANPFLDLASLADDALVETTSSTALRAYLDGLRGLYAVTIFDAGDAFDGSLALQCAGSSDGTLLAVAYGRNPVSQDTRLVTMLEQVGARIVGVVPTSFPRERIRKNGRRPDADREDMAFTAPLRRAGKSTA